MKKTLFICHASLRRAPLLYAQPSAAKQKRKTAKTEQSQADTVKKKKKDLPYEKLFRGKSAGRLRAL